ncbi:hypothetical protein NDU88_010337 [Pleurodeles waltl]|uniref:Uncharacterized protein n=1 Tax=Pleurodeles waltl TaxID=8319 RepID=A0AAV7R083_PLEWA|nr:hypothetical protein NDU88_010337 [Pleurodeles waltl]
MGVLKAVEDQDTSPRRRCSAQARRACEQRVLSAQAAPRGSLLKAGPGPGYPFQPAATGKRHGRDLVAWGGARCQGRAFFFFSLPDWETAGHVTVFPGTGRAAGSPSRDFPDREIHASPPFTSRPSTASRPDAKGYPGDRVMRRKESRGGSRKLDREPGPLPQGKVE